MEFKHTSVLLDEVIENLNNKDNIKVTYMRGNKMFDTIISLKKDNNNVYKKGSNLVKTISDGLVYMTNFIKNEHKGESVLTIVIKMA